MKVAIIGNGIVAAFAAAAARDSGCGDIHIYAPTNSFTLPPVGAFYLHELPGTMIPQPPVPMLELRLGSDVRHYARLMGVSRETSLSRMPMSTVRGVFLPTQEVFDMLTSGNISWFDRVVMTTGGMRQLLEHYDAVVCTVNIPQDELETPASIAKIGVVPLHHMLDEYRPALTDHIKYDVSQLPYVVHGSQYCSVYNAHVGSWLRYTSFGPEKVSYLEVPLYTTDYMPSVIPVIKVPKLAENTLPRESMHPNLIFAGRFATWNRKDLSHHAYYQVQQGLRNIKETI